MSCHGLLHEQSLETEEEPQEGGRSHQHYAGLYAAKPETKCRVYSTCHHQDKALLIFVLPISPYILV